MSQRTVTHRYQDPLDAVWLAAASAVGLRVERGADVYASTDGKGTLHIGADDALDADDCLAQMILHELCHWLVMGQDSFHEPDWGLCNETDRDVVLEHACLRAQAALLDPYGLRQVFAPTTDYRAFYDSLGADPFALPEGVFDDGSVVRGRVAWSRSRQAPWAPHLAEALSATADIVHAVARACERAQSAAGAAAPLSGGPSIYQRRTPRAAKHPAGFPLDNVPGRHCKDCSWHYVSGGKSPRSFCRQSEERIDARLPSCERFENAVDCLTCGACCREAYDVVVVARRDPAVRKHASLMVLHEGRGEMRRASGKCIALCGGSAVPGATPPDENGQYSERPAPPLHMPSSEPYTCKIYEDRPRTCRDFTLGGSHCLTARRRVGLSR